MLNAEDVHRRIPQRSSRPASASITRVVIRTTVAFDRPLTPRTSGRNSVCSASTHSAPVHRGRTGRHLGVSVNALPRARAEGKVRHLIRISFPPDERARYYE